ncbi:MAG: hypothetical protein ACRDIL_17395, partial [Candidatus Limnocylindrales bacterium]
MFENSAAIFANEVRPAGEQGLQLMAEGPRTAEPQPRPGEDARVWLERKVGATAWRITAYAITTDFVVAFLMIDGPPASWAGWDDDVRL